MENLKILNLAEIDSQIPRAIRDIRSMILNCESYNFSARVITKFLYNTTSLTYMALIPNDIDFPIDLLAINRNRVCKQVFAVYGGFCIEIPIMEYVKQYENYEAFCTLQGCYAIPSERANKIKERFEIASYPNELVEQLALLVSAKAYPSDSTSTAYYEYSKKVVEYRKELLDKIANYKDEKPFLVMPYHQQ